MAEVVDRANRCESAQKQAYNLLIVHAGRLADANALRSAGAAAAAATAGVDSLDGAVARVHEVFEDFLDDHKVVVTVDVKAD